MLKSLGRLALLLAVLAAGACAQIPLHANLTDAELHQRLNENFQPGMTRPAVDAKLDELKVSGKARVWYDTPPSPPQLLVRLYQPGGLWLDEGDQLVEWVDAVFVFGREQPPLLERTATFRSHQRYWHGDPVNIPATPTKYPWGRYPIPPPPPLDPLVGARS